MRLTDCQSMACQSVTPWKDAPAGSASDTSIMASSAVICFSSYVVWSSFLVMKDLAEVCSLSRETWGSKDPLSILPITGRLSLFPLSCTRCPVGASCDCLPKIGGHWAYRVPHR